VSREEEGVREAGFVRTQLTDPLARHDAEILSLWVDPEANELVGEAAPLGASDGTGLADERGSFRITKTPEPGEGSSGDPPSRLTKTGGRPKKQDPLVFIGARIEPRHKAFCDAHGGPSVTIRQALDLLMTQQRA